MADHQYFKEEFCENIKIHDYNDNIPDYYLYNSKPISFSVNFVVHYIDRMTLVSKHNNDDEADVEIVRNDHERETKKSGTLPYNPNNKLASNNLDFCIRFILNLEDLTEDIFDEIKAYVKENPQPAPLVVDIDLITEYEVSIHDSEIKALKKVRVEEMGFKDGEEYCCSICLENLAEKNNKEDVIMVTCMPCKHAFHDACIIKWLESMNQTWAVKKTSPCCPSCRFDLEKYLISVMKELPYNGNL